MTDKRRKTLEQVFETPERGDIAWRDIESLFAALGAEVTEGRGSRVRVALNEVRAVFHRPHPQKEANKATVKSVRRFLKEARVKP
ncbi:MAG: type II toxin-antitoxin system HicA family toxin [Candidatus Sumerlaeota bacterium]|nr:type II toxin-antitoxin system HicA family toxin [Candidatus Sumerlaeota bacterium]